jgi:hypothetical protein
MGILEKVPAPNSRKEKKDKPSLLARIKAALSFGNNDAPDSERDEPAVSSQNHTESMENEPALNSHFFTLQRKGKALLTSPVTLTNTGDKAVWMVTTVQGSPIAAPEPVENGFTVFREYYNTAGEPMPVDAVQQGELLVVTLQGEVKAGADFQALLVDLLPAGFEIERPITEQDTAFSWLKNLTRNGYVDIRDDRFVASFATKSLPKVEGDNKLRRFGTAYLVRAVTPGMYTLPPVEIEAMYRPEFRARSGGGVMIISH